MPTLLNFSAKNTRLAIVAIVAIVAETFNPSFAYNIRQICQSYFLFIPHSHSPSSTPPQRSQTRNKTNANGHQIGHSYQLRRLFGRNGRNGQIARGYALAMKSSALSALISELTHFLNYIQSLKLPRNTTRPRSMLFKPYLRFENLSCPIVE